MTIDRALSDDPFRVDQILCWEAAQGLRGYVGVHRSEPWSDLAPLSQLLFKILFISVCHQFNWDYLQGAMAGWLLPAPEAMLDRLEGIRSTEVSHLLSGYSKPERIRAQQRARMIRETARCLTGLMRDGVLLRLLSDRKLAGPDGFYASIKAIPAFAEDPLEKKVRVLAHDLYREGIIRFSDPANLKPAVEYHILRIYLRSGRVYPVDESVKEALTGPSFAARGRLVRLLRYRVEDAMHFTSQYSGLDVATLNYLEWQMGRSICIPDPPALCLDPPHEELPSDVGAVCQLACAFAGFCRTRNQPSYGWFQEPQFKKAIY